jgi:hypothetical protein
MKIPMIYMNDFLFGWVWIFLKRNNRNKGLSLDYLVAKMTDF